MDEERRIKKEYAEMYQSRTYPDGREEQIRLPEREMYTMGIECSSVRHLRREPLHVQAFVNNISAPKSLEELILFVKDAGRFTIEEVLYNDSTSWTVPRWAKYGDIVFYMHTKTANSSLTAIRTKLYEQKDHFPTDDFNEYMEWINRGLSLHKQYGGKIFAVARVLSKPEPEYDSPINSYHWNSRLYADIDQVTLLENPVDISEFRDFLMISRCSGITPVFGEIYDRLKALIAKKNKLPYFFEIADATPVPLAKINLQLIA